MKTQDIKNLVNKYGISVSPDGQNLVIKRGTTAKQDNAVETIKSSKKDILAYFAEQVARQSRIDNIEGLKLLRNAINDLENWRVEFERSFYNGDDAVGGLGVRPKPTHDIDALKAKYPCAAAYLRAEEMWLKDNYNLSEIGKRAINKFYDDPNNYKTIIEDMESEISAFVDNHIWD